MSSSKSKKRSSAKIEESVDMDTDIAHQQNDPIEIEEEETQGAPTSKSVGNISSKSKRMAKE